MIAAALTALAVFVAVLMFVSSVNANVGNQVDAVVLKTDVKAYQPITQEMVETRQVPEKWLSPTSIRNPGDVVGLVPVQDLKAGSFAQVGMFQTRPGLQPGFREMSVRIDAITGVGGKIRSGDHVDIIASRSASQNAEGGQVPARTECVAQNVLIVDVGVAESADSQQFAAGSQAVPVTFALSVDEMLMVANAEESGVIRLALRSPMDTQNVSKAQCTYVEGNG